MTNTPKKITTKKLKHKTQFHFRGIKIFYDLPNQADVYFLEDNTPYNKSVHELMLEWGYKRLGLHKSNELVEVYKGFEYTRHGVYARDDENYLANHDIRENIRKLPFIFND